MDDEKKVIKINPVTRIEGHAKITLQLNDLGEVQAARFHVDEFRGFEKFCEGRLYTEMPTITPRICGICPVSHAVASAKACEQIMRVEIPETAVRLRKLLHLGQIVSSHALSFFYLSAPDWMLGWDAEPSIRNIVGLADRFPEVAKRGIRMRKFGQEISEKLTGKKIHAMGFLPGGMAEPMKVEDQEALLSWIPEVSETALQGLNLLKGYLDSHHEEVESFAPGESLYLGLVGPGGEHELYDGKLRWVDADGKIVADQLDPSNYLSYISEKPVEWSFLKYPYYKPFGETKGVYRVGPLARLNVATRLRTPKAQQEFLNFKSLGRGRAVHGAFYYHYARLIEMMTAIEQIDELLRDDRILGTDTKVAAGRNQLEGIGCAEAPRGTLFHHYTVDENGVLNKVNLLIATGQNNPSMNQSVLEVAKKYVRGLEVKEGALNRVEAAIRCYDPCLSCSTHAIGSMPLILEFIDCHGAILKTMERN